MTHLLTAAAGRRALEDVIASGGLLAFELDGALAPPGRERGGASLRAPARELLARLAAVHPCAVVSGRGRQDVLDRLCGVPVAEVLGSHGAEPLPAGVHELHVRRRVALWHALLAPELLGIPGVEVEDRRVSLAIRFGRARDPSGAERRARAALRRAAGARAVEGPLGVDLVPEELPERGAALRRLCSRLGVATALYVGAPAAAELMRAAFPGLVAVQVGGDASSDEWSVEDPRAVDDVLRAALELASLRGPSQVLA